MLPNVQLSQIDGALGIIPPSNGDIQVVLGPSTTGPFDTIAAFGSAKYVQQNFGLGPLVENACYQIEKLGRPVVVIRTKTTGGSDGGYETIDVTGVTGTATVTVDATTHPIDEYDAYFIVVHGGTTGSAGITYQSSLDNGRTLSPVTALGTALTIVIPNSNVTFDVDTGKTLVAGDVVKVRTTPPVEGAADLTDALTALSLTRQPWDFVNLCSNLGATEAAAVDAWLSGLFNGGKYYWAIGNTRQPATTETETTYNTALAAAFSATSSLFLSLAAGYTQLRSAVSSRQYARPASWALAARAASTYIGQDWAEVDLGPLSDARILDANGNPVAQFHDEEAYPGLDDLRFATLRSIDGYQGVYNTNPRIIAPTGSDFIFAQFRRVMNVACRVVRAELMRRLSKQILVNKKTGFILESEARDIEAGVNTALRTALLTRPDASDAKFVLSRTDNVLSTFTLHGDTRIVPLAYPKSVIVTMGFNNPAIRVQAV